MGKRSLLTTYVLWVSPIVVLVVSGVAVWASYSDRMQLQHTDHLARELELYQEVRQRILERYVGDVDAEEIMLAALAGMTQPLDPHSRFQDPKSYAEFRKATDGVIPGGIGVRIRAGKDGVLVMTPLWGTPALVAGIRPQDLIVGIDDHPTPGLTTQEVSDLLGGEVGTDVTLGVRRGEDDLEITIRRADIRLASVAQLGFVAPGDAADESPAIGYLRLSSFQEDSGREVTAAIDRLRTLGMESLVFDLRSNLGGRLSAATEIADLLLSDGIIVTTQGRGVHDYHVTHATDTGTLPDFPIVCLVDSESASASEVLAGALQDHQRALILGQRTWGKGSVQEIFPLDSDMMALKLTTKRYLTPRGRSLHREPGARTWGITPDISIELDDDEKVALDDSWLAAEVVTEPAGERPLVAPNLDRQLASAVRVLEGEEVFSDPVIYR